MLKTKKVLSFAAWAIFVVARYSWAESPVSKPSRVELGPKTIPQDILRCQRYYLHREKRFPCDSPLAADGEGLRPLLATVPQAALELDEYQNTRNNLKFTAYTGIAGILVGVLGPNFTESKSTQSTVRTIGLSITLTSLIWGRVQLLKNEGHLKRAIQHFNQANPAEPIQLQPSSPR